MQKCAVSNEAVQRNILWLTCECFPNLWPLNAIAVMYLTESHKYACWVWIADIGVKDMLQVSNPASTGSDTHGQVEGDNDGEFFSILTAVNQAEPGR